MKHCINEEKNLCDSCNWNFESKSADLQTEEGLTLESIWAGVMEVVPECGFYSVWQPWDTQNHRCDSQTLPRIVGDSRPTHTRTPV